MAQRNPPGQEFGLQIRRDIAVGGETRTRRQLVGRVFLPGVERGTRLQIVFAPPCLRIHRRQRPGVVGLHQPRPRLLRLAGLSEPHGLVIDQARRPRGRRRVVQNVVEVDIAARLNLHPCVDNALHLRRQQRQEFARGRNAPLPQEIVGAREVIAFGQRHLRCGCPILIVGQAQRERQPAAPDAGQRGRLLLVGKLKLRPSKTAGARARRARLEP